MGHDDLLWRDNLNHIMDMFCFSISVFLLLSWGWSGGAMVLGKLPVPGRPTFGLQ